MNSGRRYAISLHVFGTAVALLILGAIVGAIVWAQNADEILVIAQAVDNDVYVARREVNVQAAIDGDLVAAGNRVTVDGEVTGDILAAAKNIEIRSAVDDDVRVAGQNVLVTGPVAGHIVAAGQTVKIEQPIGEWAWLSGDTVAVSGNVNGQLEITGKNITINSEIDGNARLIGGTLRLGPDAMVHGNVEWRSNNKADISPEAQIDGQFIEEPLPEVLDGRSAGGGLVFTFSIFLTIVTLFLLFPRSLHACANRVSTHPAMSLILGFALLVAPPVLAVLLLITKLGAWLGLAVLGIYLVVLLLGIMTGLFTISDVALRRFQPHPAGWQPLIAIFVTVAAVGLLTYVPWVGFIIVLATWLLGIGALGLQFAQGYANSRA